jgi:hypothetical protein
MLVGGVALLGVGATQAAAATITEYDEESGGRYPGAATTSAARSPSWPRPVRSTA